MKTGQSKPSSLVPLRNGGETRKSEVICPRSHSQTPETSRCRRACFRDPSGWAIPKLQNICKQPNSWRCGTLERVASERSKSPKDSKSSIELVSSVKVPLAVNESRLFFLRYSFLTREKVLKMHPHPWTQTLNQQSPSYQNSREWQIEVPRNEFTEMSGHSLSLKALEQVNCPQQWSEPDLPR